MVIAVRGSCALAVLDHAPVARVRVAIDDDDGRGRRRPTAVCAESAGAVPGAGPKPVEFEGGVDTCGERGAVAPTLRATGQVASQIHGGVGAVAARNSAGDLKQTYDDVRQGLCRWLRWTRRWPRVRGLDTMRGPTSSRRTGPPPRTGAVPMQVSGGRVGTSALAAFAAGVALVACGGSDKSPAANTKAPATVAGNQRGIIGTVAALQTASRAGDSQGICADIFTVQLVHSIEAAAKRSCVKEIKHTLVSPNAEISISRDIQVAGPRATATIRERNGKLSKLFLLKQDGRWRIDRVVPSKAA